ncbi:MAG: hypothetical protein Q7O66_14675 [Dehalococcoidia bacterium]|nr:hypothetical protein [Dehalococcoidia bacterium]
MTQIDVLRKKYPSIPPDVILKWEILNHGVRDSGDIDKVSDWSRAGTNFSYQSYDHDLTLKEVVDRKPTRLKDGRILRPRALRTKNGIGASVRINTRSPYEIRELANGQFAIFEGDDQVDVDVYFLDAKPRTTPEPVTSKGTPVSNFISPKRRCFSLMPVRYCEYFASGDQCKYCNFNSTQEDSRSVGLDRPVTINLDETVEAYKILSSEIKLIEGRFEMGGFRNSVNEGRIYFDFLGRLSSAASYKPNFTVVSEAIDRKDMQRLKDAGLDSINVQVEIWEPHLFTEVCPGKAEHSPHERWLDTLLDAVDIFGVGNVSGKIIAGLSLIPRNGYETWQESRDAHIEANRWMFKQGVIPVFGNLRLPPGSVYWNDQSLRQKLPPTDLILDVALAHHDGMLEYDLYSKYNKLMYCPLECLDSIYAGEIGMLALAGDIGNWMDDVVPKEESWLAQFIASVK